MTNFEKIKQMSVDELADKIISGISCSICDYCKENENMSCNEQICYGKSEKEFMIAWLKSEVEQ